MRENPRSVISMSRDRQKPAGRVLGNRLEKMKTGGTDSCLRASQHFTSHGTQRKFLLYLYRTLRQPWRLLQIKEDQPQNSSCPISSPASLRLRRSIGWHSVMSTPAHDTRAHQGSSCTPLPVSLADKAKRRAIRVLQCY